MTTNKPMDSEGRPLPRPAAAEGWAAWQKWGEQINQELQKKANSAEVNASIRSIVTNATDVIEKLAIRLKELRADVDKLKSDYNLMAWIGTVEQRLGTLETRTPHQPSGTVTEGEVALLKQRLHGALGGAMAELAEKRLGTEQAPAATRRGTNGLSIHGEAHGEVVSPTPPTTT
jgi:hypothetical protein